jgi:hypothetical protein
MVEFVEALILLLGEYRPYEGFQLDAFTLDWMTWRIIRGRLRGSILTT